MPELSFRYTSAARPAEERDLLLLEQEEWNHYTGLLTRAGFLRYLRAVLYDTDDKARILCPIGNDLAIRIFAWPLAPGVVFRLRASVGALGEVTVDTVRSGESLTFSLSDRADLKHPASRVEAIRWLTGPYDAEGRLVAPPSASVSGREITLSAPVWGAAWIETAATRYACVLTLPRDAAEPLLAAGWSEWVIGLPEGGRPVALELAAPPGAEALAAAGAGCGRASYRVKPSGGDGRPEGYPADKRINCDYCELECEEPTYG